jgi:hypothetical protein
MLSSAVRILLGFALLGALIALLPPSVLPAGGSAAELRVATVLAVGLLCGGAISVSALVVIRAWQATETPRGLAPLLVGFGIGWLAGPALFMGGHPLTAAAAGVSVLLAFIAAALALEGIRMLAAGQRVRVETHWGGLGGGAGGLEVSRPAALLLLALMFSAGALGALHLLPRDAVGAAAPAPSGPAPPAAPGGAG